MTAQGVNAEEDADMSDSKIVTLNVGGQRFATALSTFRQTKEDRPSMLVQMFSKENTNIRKKDTEYFFDRDATIFESIMRYYRTGLFIAPKDVPAEFVRLELEYWQISIPDLEQKLQPEETEEDEIPIPARFGYDNVKKQLMKSIVEILEILIDEHAKRTGIRLQTYIFDFWPRKPTTIVRQEADPIVITPQLIDHMTNHDVWPELEKLGFDVSLAYRSGLVAPLNFPLDEEAVGTDGVMRMTLHIIPAKHETRSARKKSSCNLM